MIIFHSLRCPEAHREIQFILMIQGFMCLLFGAKGVRPCYTSWTRNSFTLRCVLRCFKVPCHYTSCLAVPRHASTCTAVSHCFPSLPDVMSHVLSYRASQRLALGFRASACWPCQHRSSQASPCHGVPLVTRAAQTPLMRVTVCSFFRALSGMMF